MIKVRHGNSFLSSLNVKKRRAARTKARTRNAKGQFKKMNFVENYGFNSITLPWER
jgi:hypothetical protein